MSLQKPPSTSASAAPVSYSVATAAATAAAATIVAPCLTVTFGGASTANGHPGVFGKQGLSTDVDLSPTFDHQAFTLERLLVSAPVIVPAIGTGANTTDALTLSAYEAGMATATAPYVLGSLADPLTWNLSSIVELMGYAPAKPTNNGAVLTFVATITGCPKWLSHDGTVTGTPTVLSVWQDIVMKLVLLLQKYTTQVRYIEILNEPTITTSFTYPSTYSSAVAAYVAVFTNAANGVAAVNKSNQTINGQNLNTQGYVTLPTYLVGGPASSDPTFTSWGADLIADTHANPLLGFLSFHSNPAAAQLTQDAADVAAWIALSNPTARPLGVLPVLITSWNAQNSYSGVGSRLTTFLVAGLTGSTQAPMTTEATLVPSYGVYAADATPTKLASGILGLGAFLAPFPLYAVSVFPAGQTVVTTAIAAVNTVGASAVAPISMGQPVVYLTNDNAITSTSAMLPDPLVTLNVYGLQPSTSYVMSEYEASSDPSYGDTTLPRRVRTVVADPTGFASIPYLALANQTVVGLKFTIQYRNHISFHPSFQTTAVTETANQLSAALSRSVTVQL